MQNALEAASAALGTHLDGPEVWGWRGRTVSSRARHRTQGLCWLRLATAQRGEEGGKLWEGNSVASALWDRVVHKPALLACKDLTDGTHVHRAELHEYVSEPVLSPDPVMRTEPSLPDAWFDTLRTDLATVAPTPTDRVAVRQEWIDRAVPHYLGLPSAPKVTQWTTAHGDLHPANLTAATPQILDWEGFGIAPVGYDAAMLYAYSLLAPRFAGGVHRAFPVLNTRTGRTAQLVVLAELLQSASRGDHPDLVPELRRLRESQAVN
jgi:hypothetical protein